MRRDRFHLSFHFLSMLIPCMVAGVLEPLPAVSVGILLWETNDYPQYRQFHSYVSRCKRKGKETPLEFSIILLKWSEKSWQNRNNLQQSLLWFCYVLQTLLHCFFFCSDLFFSCAPGILEGRGRFSAASNYPLTCSTFQKTEGDPNQPFGFLARPCFTPDKATLNKMIA